MKKSFLVNSSISQPSYINRLEEFCFERLRDHLRWNFDGVTSPVNPEKKSYHRNVRELAAFAKFLNYWQFSTYSTSTTRQRNKFALSKLLIIPLYQFAVSDRLSVYINIKNYYYKKLMVIDCHFAVEFYCLPILINN